MTYEIRILHETDGGVRCVVSGPGIDAHDPARWPVLARDEVLHLQGLLGRVYEAGRQAKAEEVLAVLGAQPARRFP